MQKKTNEEIDASAVVAVGLSVLSLGLAIARASFPLLDEGIFRFLSAVPMVLSLHVIANLFETDSKSGLGIWFFLLRRALDLVVIAEFPVWVYFGSMIWVPVLSLAVLAWYWAQLWRVWKQGELAVNKIWKAL